MLDSGFNYKNEIGIVYTVSWGLILQKNKLLIMTLLKSGELGEVINKTGVIDFL
jgi:hypothetical protein